MEPQSWKPLDLWKLNHRFQWWWGTVTWWPGRGGQNAPGDQQAPTDSEFTAEQRLQRLTISYTHTHAHTHTYIYLHIYIHTSMYIHIYLPISHNFIMPEIDCALLILPKELWPGGNGLQKCLGRCQSEIYMSPRMQVFPAEHFIGLR